MSYPFCHNQLSAPGLLSEVRHYSEEYKEKLVQEMMSPSGRRVSEIHRATGISENTLYSWKNKYGAGREAEPGGSPKPENWMS